MGMDKVKEILTENIEYLATGESGRTAIINPRKIDKIAEQISTINSTPPDDELWQIIFSSFTKYIHTVLDNVVSKETVDKEIKKSWKKQGDIARELESDILSLLYSIPPETGNEEDGKLAVILHRLLRAKTEYVNYDVGKAVRLSPFIKEISNLYSTPPDELREEMAKLLYIKYSNLTTTNAELYWDMNKPPEGKDDWRNKYRYDADHILSLIRGQEAK